MNPLSVGYSTSDFQLAARIDLLRSCLEACCADECFGETASIKAALIECLFIATDGQLHPLKLAPLEILSDNTGCQEDIERVTHLMEPLQAAGLISQAEIAEMIEGSPAARWL